MRIKKNNGLTVIEFLLVIIIIGILLAVIVARGKLAAENVRYGQALQQGSEIAGYLVALAQKQSEASPDNSPDVVKNFFLSGIGREEAGTASVGPLVDRYTGNENFDAVEKMIPGDQLPQNPFNGVSYFDSRNDDPENVPSSRRGLLYFTSAVNENHCYFYLLVTSLDGGWYNDADLQDPEALRRGIFVAQTSN